MGRGEGGHPRGRHHRHADLHRRQPPVHDHGHDGRLRHGTRLRAAGHAAPTGGVGGTHGEIPEGGAGSDLAGEMEADGQDIQAVRNEGKAEEAPPPDPNDSRHNKGTEQ